jgi:hypothetical protein
MRSLIVEVNILDFGSIRNIVFIIHMAALPAHACVHYFQKNKNSLISHIKT